jgi:hypothetical protein
LGLWIVKAAREPVFLIVENIGDADILLIAVDAFDRSGENPRVAVEDWAFAAFLEE